MVLVLDGPELLDGPLGVAPDAARLVESQGAVVLLVADVEDGVVGELHGEVVPHAVQGAGPTSVDAFGLGLAVGADPPAAVAGAPPAIGRHLEALVADPQPALPGAGLGEARSIEEDPAVAAQELVLLLDGGDGAPPVQVTRDAVLVLLEDEAQLLEGLHDLDAEGTHPQVHAVAQLLRGPHDVLLLSPPHAGESVLDGQVRVLPHAHDHEELVARGVEVEVVAVVEIAVAGADEAHRLGGLMDGEVVPG